MALAVAVDADPHDGQLGLLDLVAELGAVQRPAVGDHVGPVAVFADAAGHVEPVLVDQRLAAQQGHPLAAQLTQFVADAQHLVFGQLVCPGLPRRGAAVLAAHVAGQGQLPDHEARVALDVVARGGILAAAHQGLLQALLELLDLELLEDRLGVGGHSADVADASFLAHRPRSSDRRLLVIYRRTGRSSTSPRCSPTNRRGIFLIHVIKRGRPGEKRGILDAA